MKQKYGQHGATLITALVMLVVLTLLVISAIRSSTTSLRIAGNMQVQEENIAAGQQAIEQVISSNFTAAPAPATIPVVISGTTYPAQILTPVCTGSTPLLNSTPNLPSDCLSSGSVQNTGIIYTSGVANTQMSWCSAQQWVVQATVSDPRTGATATIHQGVSLNVPSTITCTGNAAVSF